ncbi:MULTISPECIES: NAD(P)/FAD-dependent oxidoreductase [unclassified Sedimentibacter]|uniref:NAD(P)/FAD-dependent oxidoreductase n=1 Tax=unclassified Sedimentibacter TaxID=2649220 RepID=UPI0027DFAE82|nr:NAD(P)/FAD-dependent oxidoreductase [Sedimentibacter sp. MB35-C1]WMJ78164.1 NAD(P)/FAD-dependent oxidoreductase [Sedimentibacter sp. MB35-C1]
MKYDVIVIGAGPAGLLSALSVKNKKVLVLEKNKEPGRKLLISGLGQCNYTNSMDIEDFLKRYGRNGRFLKSALYNFTNIDTMNFFSENGLESFIREDGKVFPASMKSSDVLNVLINCLQKRGVDILYDEGAKKAAYDELNKMYLIKTNKASYASTNLIISTGGKSYPRTGSTGDGYNLAEQLGHTIVEPKEALVPVYTVNYKFKELAGISFEDIKVSLWRNNRKSDEFNGDFLFTHTGISGPVILNNSRYIEEGDVLKINFTSFKNSEEFKRYFDNLILSSGKLSVKTVLKQMNIPKRFTEKIMELAGVNENKLCSILEKAERKNLCGLLSAHEFKVERLGGFNTAMVTAGGVSTREISSKTMESKIRPGLYFAGEVVDYDGDTGGFNIQAAFSTGKLAADSINKK